ncbi:hypothetical protein LCGC14_2326960 [marine sediment metagenome]|uniref:Uncharacterized protein n=1 Tax=marine sediment metagenome TaxID=412755 RepID=A0A0F9CGS7_9ZZZZ
MAENDKCIERVVSVTKYREAIADHHEWRFLRQGMIYGDAYSIPPTNVTVFDIYYCVFCLKQEKREV